MKKKLLKPALLFLTSVAIASVFMLTVSCEEETPETCEEEEICAGKTVSACCTADLSGEISCVYKYNGKEYPAGDIELLAEDLGCASTKSTSYEEDYTYIIIALEDLMARVQCR